MIEATFVKLDTSGDKYANVLFKATNKSGKKIRNSAGHVFYYDKSGKLMKAGETYSQGSGLGVGETKELGYGFVDDGPKNAATIEVEVTEVTFEDDDSTWSNEALIDGTRPKGGIR